MVKRVEDSKKQKSVDTAISQIEKQFGKGSIMRLAGDAGTINNQISVTGQPRPAPGGGTGHFGPLKASLQLDYLPAAIDNNIAI